MVTVLEGKLLGSHLVSHSRGAGFQLVEQQSELLLRLCNEVAFVPHRVEGSLGSRLILRKLQGGGPPLQVSRLPRTPWLFELVDLLVVVVESGGECSCRVS